MWYICDGSPSQGYAEAWCWPVAKPSHWFVHSQKGGGKNQKHKGKRNSLLFKTNLNTWRKNRARQKLPRQSSTNSKHQITPHLIFIAEHNITWYGVSLWSVGLTTGSVTNSRHSTMQAAPLPAEPIQSTSKGFLLWTPNEHTLSDPKGRLTELI